MEIVSTNRAAPVTLSWKGRDLTTGIFKMPHQEGIYLEKGGVSGDTVGNPDVHGGHYKACYLFAVESYPFWEGLYPQLDWQYGMFGENLSVAGLDERHLSVGTELVVGEALLRITSPREPCFKLGLRFQDQAVIEKFIAHGRPGAYAEVLREGWVRPGDILETVTRPDDLSIAEYFKLLFEEPKDPKKVARAMQWHFLSENTRQKFGRWMSK